MLAVVDVEVVVVVVWVVVDDVVVVVMVDVWVYGCMWCWLCNVGEGE